MKMYVWEDVLEDYTSGMVCVLARNEKQAWEMLYKEDDTAWWVLQGRPSIYTDGKNAAKSTHDIIPKCGYLPLATRPKEITEPHAFIVWGGG